MDLIKQEKQVEAKKLLLDWSQTCTCHGVPNLFRPASHSLTRLVWFICLVVSGVLCSYLVARNIIAYLNYDTNTQINVYEVTSQFDMPSVRICSQAIFATPNGTNYVLDYFRRRYKDVTVNSLSDLMITLNKSSRELNPDFIELTTSLLEPSEQTVKARQTYGYAIETMLIYCTINGKECNKDDFDYSFDPVYGNCFGFNSASQTTDEQDKHVDRPGQDYGLNVEMFIGPPHLNASQNLFYADRTRGLRLVIHNKTYRPLRIDGIDVETGACTNIQMRKKFVSHIGSPYESSCIQADSLDSSSSYLINTMRNNNITYRQEYCLELCQQAYIIKNCSCSSIDYANDFRHLGDKSDPCRGAEGLHCTKLAKDKISERNYQFLEDCKEKYCPLECESLSYEFFESVVDYPSEAYADYLFLDSTKKIAETFDAENVPKTYDNLAKSLVCFSVYFNKLEYTVISETPAIEIIDLISNAGGTLGLFLGISLLSFIEIIELVFELAVILFSNRKNQVDSAKMTI